MPLGYWSTTEVGIVMAIDIGTRIDGMTVASISFDPPELWLSCGNGHRVWTTPQILDGGMKIICTECAREAQQRTARQERSREADELLAAGRENDQAYEDLIADERRNT
jgi:hypothetical protein